jgi:hypothetical protein
MNRASLLCLALVAGALPLAPSATAQPEVRQVQVQFPKGRSATTIQGSIRGSEVVDYRLRAAAGQEMKIGRKSGSVYFNVLPPGSNDEALFVGSRDGDRFAGTLSVGGDYRIRVYQMGNARSTGQRTNFAIEASIVGSTAGAAAAASDHVERASQGRFDATGRIPCAWEKGQPMNQCDFGVARAGGGTAAVVVTRPDGRKRFVFFDKGRATGADLSQADGDMTFRATKQDGLYTIRAGRERYEMPEAVIFGG